jgi:lysophospholipase L1-like esterase
MTRPGGPRRGAAELLLILGSLAFLALIGALAELAVRAFSAVDLLGNSRNLFAAGVYGASNGNAPNVEASSFGRIVYTDEYGFRIPKGGVPGDAARRQAILILGDSVGFGPAVEEAETLAGRLRARFPEWRIYNSSVIGYTTRDYRNVVEAFLPRHPEVKAVVLLYCLNDVSAASAQNIDRYLEQEKQGAPEWSLTETLRSFTLLSDANDYLRSRSKLYLLLRHRLLRTQTRDWRAVRQLYAEEHSAGVEQSVRDIAWIGATLEQRGIPFAVVLSPFEYQLRSPEDPEAQVPQRMLGELLSKAGVSTVDARPYFDAGVPSADYFLGYDPMHFSALGHRVMAEVVAAALAEVTPGARSRERS